MVPPAFRRFTEPVVQLPVPLRVGSASFDVLSEIEDAVRHIANLLSVLSRLAELWMLTCGGELSEAEMRDDVDRLNESNL